VHLAASILSLLLAPTPDPSQWQAALALAQPAKVAVAAFYVENNRFPARDDEVPLPKRPALRPSDPRVRVVAGGSIELTFDAFSQLGSGRVFLVPSVASSGLSWECVTPDLASLPRVAPDCRFAAGYRPSIRHAAAQPTGPPGSRMLVHNQDGSSYTLDFAQLLKDRFVNADGFYGRPLDVFRLATDQSRADIVAGAVAWMGGKIPNARSLMWTSQVFVDAGPSLMPPIEAHLTESAPDAAAVGLLAVCDLESRQASQQDAVDAYARCFDRHRPQLSSAIAYAAKTASAALPAMPRDTVPCSWILLVVGASGSLGRPALPDFAPILASGAASDAVIARRNECSHESVRAAVAEVLLSPPRDPALTEATESAVDNLVASALRPKDSTAQTTRLAALLDTLPWTDALGKRLDAIVVEKVRSCELIELDRLLVLGRVGVDVLTLILDHMQDMGCPREKWLRALAYWSQTPAAFDARVDMALTWGLQRYPETARLHHDRTRSVATRDAIVTAALELVETPEEQAAKGNQRDPPPDAHAISILKALLEHIGYVPVSFGKNGVPQFPKASGLRWQPLEEKAIALKPDAADANRAQDLGAALASLASANPRCQVPSGDSNVLRLAGQGKALFVFPCGTDSPSLVVIGSRAGFKVMNLPERLKPFEQLPGTGGPAVESIPEIMAVSDVDGDGNLEILTRRSICDNCRGWTEEESTEYALSEESGDWFTYLTAKR
jgi:Pilin (bacterial filament)